MPRSRRNSGKPRDQFMAGRRRIWEALTDAMENWTIDKRKMDTVAATLNLLDEGISLGGIKYKHREELYERK